MADSDFIPRTINYDTIYSVSFGNDSAGNSTNMTGDVNTDDKLRYSALLLSLFVILTLFGNILVVLAVKRDKNLHTVTNYLIVSLALADITVGTLVMPLAVYVEVMGGRFLLHGIVCDVWVALDVMACTSSIVNMTAISVDRYLAVNFPIFYNQNKMSNWYPTLMISVCWVVSIGTCLPIVLGANATSEQNADICTFFNPYYSVISSCVSFVIPTIVMMVFYQRILRVLHQRANKKAKAHKDKRKSNKSLQEPGSENSADNVGSDPSSFRDSSSDAIIVQSPSGVNAKSDNDNRIFHPKEKGTDEERGCLIVNGVNGGTDHVHSQQKNSVVSENNNEGSPSKTVRMTVPTESNNEGSPSKTVRMTVPTESNNSVQYGSKRSMSRLNSVVQLAQSRLMKKKEEKGEKNPKKERKAIIMLMVVLCVFLCCWLPFFITNNLQVICKYHGLEGPGCTVPEAAMSFIVWLGYINSTLNPVIYAVFNREYRHGFKKLLYCDR